MKIGILHLSDFHVQEGEKFLDEKIRKFMDSLNVLGNVDEYTIVFSGDLAASGMINEYKISRRIISKIILGIKQKCDGKFVELLMTPGNHDLTLHENSRTRKEIQDSYNKNTIEALIPNEIALLNNYYTVSHASAHVPHDKILDRRLCTYNDEFKIQFNLINTAPFSTLIPDDKELHYFPNEKTELLKKQDSINVCITVMHHTYDWFNWKYKSDLERAIINNSEFLFTGHDHLEETKEVSIDNSMDTWISCAGAMKFSNINYPDSFNCILFDTNSNSFCAYIFNWNQKERIYTHRIAAENKSLESRTSQLIPLPSFLKEIKEDIYNYSEDFSKYFVFPKLISEEWNEFGKNEALSSTDEFQDFIEKNKRVLITGSFSSGKSTLLKHLYCSIFTSKTPLFLSIDSTTRIKSQKLIKHLFEEQYGDEPLSFEKYQQLDKNKKIFIIDGLDRLNSMKSQELLMSIIGANYSYIVISVGEGQRDIIDLIKDRIDDKNSYCELRIKPFFAEKRNQLVRNICMLNSSYNDEEIAKVNKTIDKLVINNRKLFTLDPGFIIKYTEYFIKNHSYDYVQGEAIFSKVFEHGIQSSIIAFSKKADVDEIITAFEEIAGYIFFSRNDLLKIEDFCKVIEKYNDEYSIKVNADNILEIGIRAKLIKKTENFSIFFSNKNYLAYFIAKYLLRISQGEDQDYSGIDYALQNICFGINSDIILFISYLSNNTKIVMSISKQAGALLSPWEELDFEKNNVNFFQRYNKKVIEAPTKEEHDKIKSEKARIEESQYSEEIIEAKGLFTYDESDINKFHFSLDRGIKYTEMLCKALPAFNNLLKRHQKDALIKSIYSYPHKITFALLEPLDSDFDNVCNKLFEFAQRIGAEKKEGKPYTREDIVDIIVAHARAVVLSIYDHFAELCTSHKTISLLSEEVNNGINHQLERLMIIENSGDTDTLLKETEVMLKELKNEHMRHMVKLIVRKHLLCNPELPRNKKQQIVDKVFGKDARKTILLSAKQKK